MKSDIEPERAADRNLKADIVIELFHEFKTSLLSMFKSYSCFTSIFIIFLCSKYTHKAYDTKIFIACENIASSLPCLSKGTKDFSKCLLSFSMGLHGVGLKSCQQCQNHKL